jgi:6-pyruvoyltetrahydropterin/6-carboxytetrahydropterin synthase
LKVHFRFQGFAQLPKVRITRAIEFSTSLRYHRSDFSEAENAELFGRDASRHGHNYRLEVSLRGEPDAITGMVLDLKELQDLLEREIMDRFDHRDLNDDTDFFEKAAPTPENLALVIHRLLAAALPVGLLDGIRLEQDSTLYVEVDDRPPGPTS